MMNPMDRFILPSEKNFAKNDSVPADPISWVEGVHEDGVLTVKPLMVGEDIIFIEAFKGKGMVDPEHTHYDHETIAYLVSGRLRLVIDGVESIAEAGDVWRHPRGVPHLSEALEDCVQLEIKSPPRKTWYTDAEIAASEAQK
jgi:quercetin dioxygenase-like cupin family protein